MTQGHCTGERDYKEVMKVNKVRGNLTGKEEPPELLVVGSLPCKGTVSISHF